MATNRDFTLKRKNGDDIDILYPTTRWAQVEEKPTTFTPTAHSHGNITNGGAIGSTANLMVKTGTSGKLTTLPAGTTSQFLRGDGTWATPADSTTLTSLGITATSTELNYTKGVTSSIQTQLSNKVDKASGKGLSSNDYTTAEKNKLAGIASGAEVNVQADWNETDSSSDAFIKNKPTIPTNTNNYLSSVTGSGNDTVTFNRQGLLPLTWDATHDHNSLYNTKTEITSLLAGKQSTINGAASTIASTNLLADRALVSNSTGKVAVSAVTATELGYLDGVTSNIQTQLSNKANSSHTHTIANITNLQTTLDGKANSSHTHGISDILNLDLALDNKANSSHTHTIANITNLQTTLDSKTGWTQVWSGAINLNSYTSTWYSATVPSGSYIGKRIAIEVQYGSGTSYTSNIIFGVLGSSSVATASTSISKGMGWNYFDGTNFRAKTLFAYTSTSNTTTIHVGHLKTLFGSFIGTSTIEWKTSHSETLYMKKIWVIE